jgi:hypothetical protein
MPQVKDLIGKIDNKSFSDALDKTSKDFEELGRVIKSVTIPLSLFGSVYHQQMINAQDRIARQQSMESLTGLSADEIDLLNNTPLNMDKIRRENWEITVDDPQLRWEYQKGILCSPYYLIVDLINQTTANMSKRNKMAKFYSEIDQARTIIKDSQADLNLEIETYTEGYGHHIQITGYKATIRPIENLTPEDEKHIKELGFKLTTDFEYVLDTRGHA